MKRIPEEPEEMGSIEEVLGYDREVKMYYYWLNRPQVRAALGVISKLKTEVLLLDIGCGLGKIPIEIARRTSGKVQIYAVDLSENMLKVAAENAKEKKVENKIIFRQGDGKKIHFRDNTFDIVMCSGMLHHQKDPAHVLCEMKRVAKNDAHILISDVIRPWSMFILNLFVGVFGLPYSKVMKRGYRETLRSAFTVNELKQILTACGIRIVKLRRSFPHFVTIVAEKIQSR